jgi:hypothetical protein
MGSRARIPWALALVMRALPGGVRAFCGDSEGSARMRGALVERRWGSSAEGDGFGAEDEDFGAGCEGFGAG